MKWPILKKIYTSAVAFAFIFVVLVTWPHNCDKHHQLADIACMERPHTPPPSVPSQTPMVFQRARFSSDSQFLSSESLLFRSARCTSPRNMDGGQSTLPVSCSAVSGSYHRCSPKHFNIACLPLSSWYFRWPMSRPDRRDFRQRLVSSQDRNVLFLPNRCIILGSGFW